MPDWNEIFTKEGKVFETPHPDIERIANLFRERKIYKILDLGCGSGRHLVYLSNKGFEVYGLDASPKALELSRAWLKQEGKYCDLKLHRIEEKFPYHNSYFDAIVSIQVIHHNFIKDIRFTIKEINRILKTNGLIYFTFPLFGVGSRLEKWELKQVEKGTYIPQTGPEKGLPHHFFTEAEIYELFGSFKVLELYVDDTKNRALLAEKKS
jgi:SAM-dependent methyltransferase